MSDDIFDDFKKFAAKPHGGTLENWEIQWTAEGDVTQPYLVWGTCYGDDRGMFRDGSWIHTSAVLEMNEDEKYIITRNTVYSLGKPKPPTNG